MHEKHPGFRPEIAPATCKSIPGSNPLPSNYRDAEARSAANAAHKILWQLFWEWQGKENRPPLVDELAFKILEEFSYDSQHLKAGDTGDADPVGSARYLLGQE